MPFALGLGAQRRLLSSDLERFAIADFLAGWSCHLGHLRIYGIIRNGLSSLIGFCTRCKSLIFWGTYFLGKLNLDGNIWQWDKGTN